MTFTNVARNVDLSKLTFPQVVEHGPIGLRVRLRIHRTPSKVGGKDYESFTFINYRRERWQRECHNVYQKAFSRAEKVATELCNGKAPPFDLTGGDQRVCRGAVGTLNGITDISFDTTTREYA